MKLALIGCGRIGKMHCKNLLKFFPQVKVSAIFDDAMEGDYHDIPVYRSDYLMDYLDSSRLQGVIIAASSTAHVDLIKLVRCYGVPLLCEKPVSFDANELTRLIDAGGHVQVGLNRRWDPDFVQVKQAIEQGRLGKLQTIKITNRDPLRADIEFAKKSGGLFFDFTIHDFDLIHFLTGSPIVEVFAQGGVLIDKRLESINDIDSALITLRCENGTLVTVDCSRETNAGYDQRLEVFGSQASISVDNLTCSTVNAITANGDTSALPLPNFISRYRQSYINQLQGFIDGITKGEPPVSLADMRRAVKVASACLKSYQTNQPQVLEVDNIYL